MCERGDGEGEREKRREKRERGMEIERVGGGQEGREGEEKLFSHIDYFSSYHNQSLESSCAFFPPVLGASPRLCVLSLLTITP